MATNAVRIHPQNLQYETGHHRTAADSEQQHYRRMWCRATSTHHQSLCVINKVPFIVCYWREVCIIFISGSRGRRWRGEGQCCT